jgi:AhpD family alkylhydroperoxidase
MRLNPIEHPKGLFMRLIYYFTRRKFGKVITPLKVVTARVPRSARMSYEIAKVMEHGFTLERSLQSLLHLHVSQLNQCGFCVDIGTAYAIREGASQEKLWDIPNYRTSPRFTAAERAAMAYVEEVTNTGTATDETFDELRRHFPDTQIAEITMLNALENYFNLTNRPLGIESDGLCQLIPGGARWNPEFSPKPL